MAELYSYFLFNPLGSSCAPPSPSLPNFSMSQTRTLPGSQLGAATWQWLEHQGCFSAKGPQSAGMLPVGPERSATPRNSLERALEIGKYLVCRDALAHCYAPGRNRGPRRSGQGRPSSPLLPSGWKTPFIFQFIPLELRPLRAVPFWKYAFLKPEEGGVAQAALGTSLHLQSRLGWFSGNWGFSNIPSPMSLGEVEKCKASLGWGGLLPPGILPQGVG